MKEEMTRKEKREFRRTVIAGILVLMVLLGLIVFIKLEEPESIYVLSIAWVLSGLFLLFFYLIFLKK